MKCSSPSEIARKPTVVRADIRW